mmetsp:Transcript_16734/g.47624  ORF Transcript_16734/g.47624 Transcript_16734/m.47624 type:complete len:232 (-) Transcript_16734:121-816(-)
MGMDEIQPWLEHTDWSTGVLQCYASSLEENFDGPEQLVDIYTKRSPSGQDIFDYKQFFEDVGVEDPAHRKLFESWFARGSAAPVATPLPVAAAARVAAAFPTAGVNGVNGVHSHAHAAQVAPKVATPTTDQHSMSGSTPAAGASLAPMQDWIWDIDWSVGALGQYAKVFEDNFDDPDQFPDQVVEAYVLKNGNERTFDDKLFFEDLGIEDAAHRDLFRAWFAKEHGALPRA